MRRAWIAVVLGSLIGLWAAASPAGALTVTIGQVSPPGNGNGCGECSGFQLTTDPASPSYTVPALPPRGRRWTITGWSARAMDGGATTAHALVWRPTGVAGEYQLIAQSADAAIPAGQAPSFPAFIPVRPGDLLGVRTGVNNMRLVYPSSSSSDVLLVTPDNPQVGATAGAPTSSNTSAPFPKELVNVSATLTLKKCKKHKRHRAASAAKKKCKKKKRRHG